MFDALLKSALLAQPAPWPNSVPEEEEHRLLVVAEKHGIEPLLYHQLKQSGYLEQWPERIRTALRKALHYQTSIAILWEEELKTLFGALAASDVFPLMMKGAPLSHTHYPSSGLRPRGDTDLFFPERQKEAFDRLMIEMGYSRASTLAGKVISYQQLYKKKKLKNFTFAIDGHWRISNIQRFSDLLTYEETESKAVTLHAISESARALYPPHALLLACLHRVAHNDNLERLIWLYDIHLIAQKMERSEFEEFTEIAGEKNLRLVCLKGLRAAKSSFATNLYEDIVARRLESHPSSYEASAQYVTSKTRPVELLRLDLEALHGWRKLQFLKELLFPSAGYMLKKYSVSSRLFLPALYLHRAWKGFWKFTRGKSPDGDDSRA